MNFTALDFETANPRRNSACAVGVAVVEGGVVVETFGSLIRPRELFFSSFNTAIHGIAMEDVLDQPHFNELWPELRPFLAGRVVVCHNAGFDISVLRALVAEYGLDCENFHYLCTLQVARRRLPDSPNHRLNTLAERFGIELDHHDATSDAVAAAYLAVELARLSGCGSLAELHPLKRFAPAPAAPRRRPPARSR